MFEISIRLFTFLQWNDKMYAYEREKIPLKREHYDMNTWLNKMERKFGKYAINNLSLYLIICYGFGYVIQMVNPFFMSYLALNPYLILHGQVWRLITWIVIPPSSGNPLTVILLLYCFYAFGASVERAWGTFRYNVYLFSGMIFTILGSFVILGILYMMYGDSINAYGGEFFAMTAMGSVFYAISTFYIYMSILLAYSATFPQMQILLMMIIPIKAKWLGIVYGIWMALTVLSGDMVTRVVIISSLLNFVIFFLTSRDRMHLSPKQMKRRHDFHKEVKKASPLTRHKCAICGKTEKDGSDIQFRFCSKCEGNYEYCQEHLFTHEHVKRH